MGVEEAKTKKLVLLSRSSPGFGVSIKIVRIREKLLIQFQVKVNLNYVDFKAEEFVWLNLLPFGFDNYVSTQELKK